MRFVPSSPAGLRVEIRFKIDKKKIEFYFSLIKKNFLTKKRNARVRGKTENIHCSWIHSDGLATE